jgi:TetR/AcrR family transcriptional regulator, transcriptional repressor of bet genes
MPKVVDHDARRAELAEAVWRLASREGLEALTVRRVAGEAGWSTGALVHYFRDKEELVLFTFQTVADRAGRRIARAAERITDPFELTRATLAEMLPLDAERQGEVRVWFAFLGLALTRPTLARAQRDAYQTCRGFLADTLAAAQAEGRIEAEVDCGREAVALVALVDGLAVQAAFESQGLGPKRMIEIVDARMARLETREPAAP